MENNRNYLTGTELKVERDRWKQLAKESGRVQEKKNAKSEESQGWLRKRERGGKQEGDREGVLTVTAK